MTLGRPVPTGLAVALVAAGLVPAALALASPVFLWLAVALDAAVVLLGLYDFLAAPRARDVEVHRAVEPVLSSGVPNPVRLELRLAGTRPVRGRVRDEVPPGMEARGYEQPFALTAQAPQASVPYTLPHEGTCASGRCTCASQARSGCARGRCGCRERGR